MARQRRDGSPAKPMTAEYQAICVALRQRGSTFQAIAAQLDLPLSAAYRAVYPQRRLKYRDLQKLVG